MDSLYEHHPAVVCQSADECRFWAKQASDQYAQLIKTLGIETK